MTPQNPGNEKNAGDPGWLQVHAELRDLHLRKSGTYGTDTDALANYTGTSEKLGECDEYTVLVRMVEKLERATNLIRAGRANEVKDWPDLAALAVGAEALRRRRQ